MSEAMQVTTACSTLPDEQLSRYAEKAAQQKATGLLSDAVTAFQQARSFWSRLAVVSIKRYASRSNV